MTPKVSPRRWLRVGPGLLLAIGASYFVWRQFPPPGEAPPVQRTRLDAIPATQLSAPEPLWLLAQRDELGMSATQFHTLQRLAARWERDTRDLRAELARVSGEFSRSMARDSDSGVATNGEVTNGVTMQGLQERAAPVSALSRQLSEARRAWWSEASRALTSEQRQRAERLWARRFASRPQPTSTRNPRP